MSEENQQEESTLSAYEENWAMHQFCGIPYNEAKKIDDVSERQFLLQMAVVMKRAQEQLTKAWGEVPNPDETTS